MYTLVAQREVYIRHDGQKRTFVKGDVVDIDSKEDLHFFLSNGFKTLDKADISDAAIVVKQLEQRKAALDAEIQRIKNLIQPSTKDEKPAKKDSKKEANDDSDIQE